MADCEQGPEFLEWIRYGSRERKRAMRLRARVLATLVALLVVAVVLERLSSQGPSQVPPQQQCAAELVTFTQAAGPNPKGGRRTIPAEPFRGQKRRACEEDGGELINRGCWVKLAQQPPCGRNFEHDGGCWMPVTDPGTPISGGR